MIDLIPKHQLGYVLPVLVADEMYYQFHRVFPAGCIMVGYTLDVLI